MRLAGWLRLFKDGLEWCSESGSVQVRAIWYHRLESLDEFQRELVAVGTVRY